MRLVFFLFLCFCWAVFMCHSSHKRAKSIVRACQFLFFFAYFACSIPNGQQFFVGYIWSRASAREREMIRVLCTQYNVISGRTSGLMVTGCSFVHMSWQLSTLGSHIVDENTGPTGTGTFCICSTSASTKRAHKLFIIICSHREAHCVFWFFFFLHISFSPFPQSKQREQIRVAKKLNAITALATFSGDCKCLNVAAIGERIHTRWLRTRANTGKHRANSHNIDWMFARACAHQAMYTFLPPHNWANMRSLPPNTPSRHRARERKASNENPLPAFTNRESKIQREEKTIVFTVLVC